MEKSKILEETLDNTNKKLNISDVSVAKRKVCSMGIDYEKYESKIAKWYRSNNKSTTDNR